MVFKSSKRVLEFSNPKQHVGWRNTKPVFVVFSMEMAKTLFEEFEQVVAICVAPPHSVVVDSYEQAVHFFADDKAARFTSDCVFAY